MINDSQHQLNNSTTPQLNNSTTQQLNNSTTQHLNNSTNMTKKTLTIATIILFMQLFAIKVGAININGEEKRIDTLECRKVGPGIEYYRLYLPDYPMAAYILKADLNNPYNFIETFQANDHLTKNEAMTSAYTRLTRENHTAIAGVNANFWIVSTQGLPNQIGIPHSGSMRHGEMITDPNGWNRGHGSIGFAMVDATKKLWIDDINFSGVVTIPSVGDFNITQINRERGSNELVLFNHFIGQNTATRTDNNGTEVFIKPNDNQTWTTNEPVNCTVTRIITDKGANLLEEGETVLSGSGTAKTFLSNLNVGDQLSVTMNIETLTDNQKPSISEMVTGNALVMKDGVLTNRNENEAYNSQLYPRTGIGSSADGKTLYLIVIERNGLYSAAANTATMCGLLKAFGASDVATMDGGGSAQMMLDGKIVNTPADGKERAVANGWFLFHNAPEDHITTDIAFGDLRTDIPFLANYKPVILAYNQYGVLINNNFEDYSLSCSEGLGEIAQDGSFIANGNATNGQITVTYGDVSITKNINIIAGDISFRLDSILISDKTKYPIEILNKMGTDVMSVPPHLLQWRTELEDICSVDQGVVTGLQNGITMLYGAFGEMQDSLKVYVEIPSSNSLVVDDFTLEAYPWELKASSQLSATLSPKDVPANWEGGTAVAFTYKTGRAPYIRMTNQMPLYSLPDSLHITINPGETLIEKAIVSLRANNSKQTVSIEFNQFEKHAETVLDINLHELFDINDMAIYPIWMDNINFYLLPMTANQAYILAFRNIELKYDGYASSGIRNPQQKQAFTVYPNPAQDMIYITIEDNQQPTLQLYSLNGILLKTVHASQMNISEFDQGSYLLKVVTREGSWEIRKFIKL